MCVHTVNSDGWDVTCETQPIHLIFGQVRATSTTQPLATHPHRAHKNSARALLTCISIFMHLNTGILTPAKYVTPFESSPEQDTNT